jgi:4-alpha-glucanotransferase
MEPVSAALAALAHAMGVATSYDDYLQRPTDVGAEPVRLALAAMGVDASDDAAAAASLQTLEAQRSGRALPPAIVVRQGAHTAPAAPADRSPVLLVREDGEQERLDVQGGSLQLPDDLPLGYHRLIAEASGESAHLVAAPAQCPLPLSRPSFGWMAQLYATRSERSWGIGDCGDLAELARWSGDGGAAMILVNPLHAAAPVLPQVDSPYSPTSRRYRNPLYLRIEDIPEATHLDEAGARVVAAARSRAGNADLIDRNAVFAAKMQALEHIARVERSPQREGALRRWCADEGDGLVDFATFCVLAEEHGTPWQQWPAHLRHPGDPAVRRAREAARPRLQFHMWLQWLMDTQLQAAQAAAVDGGMAVGIVHDLAVGVDPGGADAWALQDDLAIGMSVGAPPDGFNQRGQNWALPPLLPRRLPETGFQPFRDMLRSVLHHAGGIRIDHVMGLWRLWWVPQDRSAADGTYVRYPASDLLAVLALEADRAGAMVVGEDLGTVETGVREAMAEHRILSSRVLYFERLDEDPAQPMLPAAQYPRLALTSVTTHDLPTAAGWWADQEIAVQTELGLFSDATTSQDEAARKAGERRDMLDLLRSEGLISDGPTDDDLATAMHAFLARTPSLLVAGSLGDAIGDRRQPNMPGTIDAYPNWRLPLSRWTPDGAEPITLETFCTDGRVHRIVQALAGRR